MTTDQIKLGLFSSKSDDWYTPRDLFKRLNEEFKFTLDVCATKENAVCETFYSPQTDGLRQTWSGVCWMNPPYGRFIGLWMTKALIASQRDATVVALVPARTDTDWWHRSVMKSAEIRLIRGRLQYKCAVPFSRGGVQAELES